jgi:uncharacterized protein (TIGR03790 family)
MSIIRNSLSLIRFLGILMLLFLSSAQAAVSKSAEERLVILANSSSQESLSLARYYAEQRRIPADAIIALPLSDKETITWTEFVATLWEPLLAELIKSGRIDARSMDLTDAMGRRKHVVNGHTISFLVVCRGVPLRIAHDPDRNESLSPSPFVDERQLRTNQACVDSELSAMAMGPCLALGYVSNPLFLKTSPGFAELNRVIKVSRLDGPSAEAASALVDHALEAEKSGLIGRAYVDLGGPIPEGEQWFQAAGRQLEILGFDTEVDRDSRTMRESSRFDAPVLYFGWYAPDITGPMAAPEFRFPAGAIAYHLHSSSAPTLRSTRQGWVGPLVARGVTASFGNVYEPYLGLCQRPQLFLHALSTGACFGDAAYFSLPGLSWQNVIIGDPLYRPFKRPLDVQWAQRRALGAMSSGYVCLRKMSILEQAGQAKEAFELGKEELAAAPNLPLALGLARRLLAQGRSSEALQCLDFARHLAPAHPDEVPLFVETALLFIQANDPKSALPILNKLLENKTTGTVQRRELLRLCLKSARLMGDEASLVQWQKQLDALLDK